jgi:hypothetical protein
MIGDMPMAPAMPELFAGAKFKISRGRYHIESLKLEIAGYLLRDPSAYLLQFDARTGEHGIVLKRREDIPHSFALIFGDAVHNLRSALDILANELVSLGSMPTGKVIFPFADSAEGLEEQLKQKMQGVPADILDQIRKLKPYRGGNKMLRALHALDIADKHFSILKIGSTSTTGAVPMRRAGYERIAGDKPDGIKLELDIGKLAFESIDLARFPADPAGVETLGKLTGSSIEIEIADGPLAGKEVIKGLNDMADIVQSIVEMFESFCRDRSKPISS